MIFSNLLGTTSKKFVVDPSTNAGQIISGNCYDFNWATKSTVSNESNPNVRLLEDNADLNLLVSPGQYYVSSNANAATIKNCPTGDAFDLLVMPGNGNGPVTSYTVQIITTWRSAIYIRNTDYNTNAWTVWNKVAYSSDIPAPPTISTVGRTGLYSDLINKPIMESGTFKTTVEEGYTLNSNSCKYMIIGKLVHIEGILNITAVDASFDLNIYIPRSLGAKIIGLTSLSGYINNLKTAYIPLTNTTLSGFQVAMYSGDDMDYIKIKAFLRENNNKFYAVSFNSILNDGTTFSFYFNGSYIIQ